MRVALHPELEALTGKIIGCAFTVARTLGHGFLETVYRNALAEELTASGLRISVETPYPVHYRDKPVGRYFADLVVENTVIVETKAVDALVKAHQAQLLNYLKASGLPVGLLFNFARPSLEMKRVLLG
ncbi:MAG TPA: GxxExxY protein [Magnetospirillaceae bacterium]|nr:GxxExxY protein [Magnetospirillaceae bacterium]